MKNGHTKKNNRIKYSKRKISGISLVESAFIVLIFIISLTSCVGTSRVITGKPLPPTEASTIKIYTKPPAQFKEIAILESAKADFIFNPEIHNGANNKQEIIADMKVEAARLGANGILIRSLEQKSGVIGSAYGLTSSTAENKQQNELPQQTVSADNHNTLYGIAIFVLEVEN